MKNKLNSEKKTLYIIIIIAISLFMVYKFGNAIGTAVGHYLSNNK